MWLKPEIPIGVVHIFRMGFPNTSISQNITRMETLWKKNEKKSNDRKVVHPFLLKSRLRSVTCVKVFKVCVWKRIRIAGSLTPFESQFHQKETKCVRKLFNQLTLMPLQSARNMTAIIIYNHSYRTSVKMEQTSILNRE